MQPATVRDLRGCWRFSVDHLVVERVIVPDPLRLAVGIEGGPLLERRLAEAIRHQGGEGNHLRTVLCQLELEAQIGELTDQDRTQDLPMEDSFGRDFQRGKCARGDSCKYSHSKATRNSSPKFKGRSMSPISKESGICFYYARGRCTRDKCPYKHEKPAAPVEVPAAPVESSSQRRTDSPAPLPQDF